jgi:hypothetical protein
LIFAIHVPSSYGALSSRGHALIFAIHVPASYGALS